MAERTRSPGGSSFSNTGSGTMTTTEPPADRQENGVESAGDSGTIHLRNRNPHRVRWTEDVVDNENMNKKKSKICCIFHPQREFGESLGSSSDSDSDSDSLGLLGNSDDEGANLHPRNGPEHDECCGHRHSKKKKTKDKPNAYERQPHGKNVTHEEGNKALFA